MSESCKIQAVNAEQYKRRFEDCAQASGLKELAVVALSEVRGTLTEIEAAVAFAEDRLVEAGEGGLDGMLIRRN